MSHDPRLCRVCAEELEGRLLVIDGMCLDCWRYLQKKEKKEAAAKLRGEEG